MIASRKLICFVMVLICLGVMISTNSLASQGKLPKKYTETITAKNGDEISFDMVLIPKGGFMMGSPADEADRKDDEGPQHEVTVDSFYMCTTETTIGLFMAYYQETSTAKKGLEAIEEAKIKAEQAKAEGIDAVTGPTPVYGDMTMGYSKKHPAIGMTWHNAMTFCKWLSLKTGKKYRLPTEAEWEYACRAGGAGAFGSVDDPKEIGDFARFDDNSDGETGEVGKKKSNPWGLYDMFGNVVEWVHDFYSPTAYAEAAKKTPCANPRGPETGKVHVARGGDYTNTLEALRCAARVYEEPWWRSGDPQFPKSIWWLPQMDFIGFRVARTIEKTEDKPEK